MFNYKNYLCQYFTDSLEALFDLKYKNKIQRVYNETIHKIKNIKDVYFSVMKKIVKSRNWIFSSLTTSKVYIEK